MLRWILHKAIGRFERNWSYDASYMHEIADASPRAAWLFSRVTAMGQFRRDIPVAAWCAAGITAVRHEDCGPCTQLGVTMAERAGVSPAFAITVARIHPTVKYVLGHGKACMRVVVQGAPVVLDHGRAPEHAGR